MRLLPFAAPRVAALCVAGLCVAGLAGCSTPPPPKPAPVAAFVPPAPTPPTQSAPICARPAEKAAFDVNGLKSQLMVTAVSCHAEDRYNDFVLRYRTDLVDDEKSLNTFFSRAYGKRGQQEHDDYITQLANAQSQLGLQDGNQFCPLSLPMFDGVMALKTTNEDELQQFANAKPIQQSLAVEPCTDPPPAPAPVKKPVVKKGACAAQAGIVRPKS